MTPPRLLVRNLSVDRGGRPVLAALDFSLPAGVWSGLIGVNGSGKTTLLSALAGRLPTRDGVVALDGVPLAAPKDRAGGIGLSVPAERLPEAPTVARLLAEVARAHGAEVRPARLDALWRALALDEIAERPIRILSAGQRQRLGLYLPFMGDPRVVLLDEPFNALDPLIAFDLKTALRGLAADGLTIMTALHDLATVALHCGHGLLLSHGRLVETFGTEALAEARRNPSAFEAEVLERWRRAETRQRTAAPGVV